MDIASTQALAAATKLEIIASGGVASAADVEAVRTAGLPGVIIGRALYEGAVDLGRLIQLEIPGVLPPCGNPAASDKQTDQKVNAKQTREV